MPTKLYVGNLAYAVTQEDLAELFAQAGKVESAVVVSDKFWDSRAASASSRWRRRPMRPLQSQLSTTPT